MDTDFVDARSSSPAPASPVSRPRAILEARGAAVTVVEARDRVGGRVQTIRDGFAGGQHAEAGADLIEGEQTHVRELARELGLEPVRILRDGWGFYGPDARGGADQIGPGAVGADAQAARPEIARLPAGRRALGLGDRGGARRARRSRTGSTARSAPTALRGRPPRTARLLPRRSRGSVAARAGRPVRRGGRRARARSSASPAATTACRDGLAEATARPLLFERDRPARRADGTTACGHGRGARRPRTSSTADFCVWRCRPRRARRRLRSAAARAQQRAIARCATAARRGVLLQFARRVLAASADAPVAFGTDLPTGAVWDGNEEQRGPRRHPELPRRRPRLARAAGHPRERRRGRRRAISSLARQAGARCSRSGTIVWEDDPLVARRLRRVRSRFDPRFAPGCARPAGRVAVRRRAHERRWQGYMNGADRERPCAPRPRSRALAAATSCLADSARVGGELADGSASSTSAPGLRVLRDERRRDTAPPPRRELRRQLRRRLPSACRCRASATFSSLIRPFSCAIPSASRKAAIIGRCRSRW